MPAVATDDDVMPSQMASDEMMPSQADDLMPSQLAPKFDISRLQITPVNQLPTSGTGLALSYDSPYLGKLRDAQESFDTSDADPLAAHALQKFAKPADVMEAKLAKDVETPEQGAQLARAVADVNTPQLPAPGTAGQLLESVQQPPKPFTDIVQIGREIQQNNDDTTQAMRAMAIKHGMDPDSVAKLPPMWEQFLRGAGNSIVDTGLSFTSPLGLGAFGFGALPKTVQKAASLGFASQMLSQAPEQARALLEEENKPEGQRNVQKMTEDYLGVLSSLGFGTTTAAHGLLPELPTDVGRVTAPGASPIAAHDASPELPDEPVNPATTDSQAPTPAKPAESVPVEQKVDDLADQIKDLQATLRGKLPASGTDDKPPPASNETAPTPTPPPAAPSDAAATPAALADLQSILRGNQGDALLKPSGTDAATDSSPSNLSDTTEEEVGDDVAPVSESDDKPAVAGVPVPEGNPSITEQSKVAGGGGEEALPSFSKAPANDGSKAGGGLNAQWVEANLGDVKLPGAPELKVVQSVGDLPPDVQAALEDDTAKGLRTEGLLWWGHTAYLIADHISDLNAAKETYLEETLGHAGMAPLVKPGEVEGLYDLIWRGAPDEAAAIARIYRHELKSPSGKAAFVDEFVAKASRWRLQKPGLYRSVLDFLTRILGRVSWLRNIAPTAVLDATMRGLARRGEVRLAGRAKLASDPQRGLYGRPESRRNNTTNRRVRPAPDDSNLSSGPSNRDTTETSDETPNDGALPTNGGPVQTGGRAPENGGRALAPSEPNLAEAPTQQTKQSNLITDAGTTVPPASAFNSSTRDEPGSVSEPGSSTGIADQLADKLEAFKSGIKPGGPQMHIFGLAADLWDRAISMAQAVIRAGGSVGHAVDAAIRHVRENHQGSFDEDAVRGFLNEKLGGPETPAEPSTPPLREPGAETSGKSETKSENENRLTPGEQYDLKTLQAMQEGTGLNPAQSARLTELQAKNKTMSGAQTDAVASAQPNQPKSVTPTPTQPHEWGKYDLKQVPAGSDPIQRWQLFPKSATSIEANEIPKTSDGIRKWARQKLATIPRKIISPWGREVVIHHVNDVASQADHYVSGQRGMAPSPDRARVMPMLENTIRNAMAYATISGVKGRGAYLYRYADGSLHVVIVNNSKGTVERQFVATQYPHDPSMRVDSDLRVLYRNGLDGKAGGKLPSHQKPSSSQAESASDNQALSKE